MGHCDGSRLDTVCWAIALVVIVILSVLACQEMGKMNSSRAARRVTNTKSARATEHDAAPHDLKKVHAMAHGHDDASHDDMPPARRVLQGTDIHDAFAEFEVDRTMTRIDDANSKYDVSDDMFLQDFHDEDKTSFRAISKEDALKSANLRPAQQMANGRSDSAPPARTIGLRPNEFARKTIDRTVNSTSCIAFNDTDTRHGQVLGVAPA